MREEGGKRGGFQNLSCPAGGASVCLASSGGGWASVSVPVRHAVAAAITQTTHHLRKAGEGLCYDFRNTSGL